MAGSRPDASDKSKDGADASLKKPDAEKLSQSITESSERESKGEKKPTGKDSSKESKDSKDANLVDDRAADKFLAQGTVQATLAAHVPAIANVAKQDPQTASTYPQWADWHADQNDKTGDAEAAKQMRDQSKKAKAAISEEEQKAKESTPSEPQTDEA